MIFLAGYDPLGRIVACFWVIMIADQNKILIEYPVSALVYLRFSV